MLNLLWLGMIVTAVALAAWNGRLPALTEGAFDAARVSVMEIALPLVGLTALWLGMMRLADEAGLIRLVARALRRPLRWLFPEVPADHPAMGSMLMNLAANMIGLTNAATPLGLRAMKDLDRLNPHPGVATNAMCTFLALNTSSVQLIPMTAISLLAVRGAAQPTAIVGSALLATFCSTAAGIAAVKLLQRWSPLPAGRPDASAAGPQNPPRDTSGASSQPPERAGRPDGATTPDQGGQPASPPPLGWPGRVVWAAFLGLMVVCLVGLTRHPPAGLAEASVPVRLLNALSLAAVPFLLAGLPLFAALKRVPVYERFIEGAREGFQVAVRIIPYLVAMLVAIRMFREAGGIEALAAVLGPVLRAVGFPIELLPMALVRPLSGSATIGLFADLADTLGPDHLVTRMGGTLLGSTETTFYVAAVYFGAVGVRRVRHAVAAGLLADLAGVIASVAVCRWLWG